MSKLGSLILTVVFVFAVLAQSDTNEQREILNKKTAEENQRPVPVITKPQASPQKQTIDVRAYKEKISSEYQKHTYRLAALQRIRELAEQTGQPEKIKRVDALLKMEKSRHLKKIQKLNLMPAVSGQPQVHEPNK